MTNSRIFARLAKFVSKQTSQFMNSIIAPPSIKKLKKRRPKRFKPAFSIGFRGATKTYKPNGSTPAPTIDDVRRRERLYRCKIHVKNGLMCFADNNRMWTKEAAEQRAKAAETMS